MTCSTLASYDQCVARISSTPCTCFTSSLSFFSPAPHSPNLFPTSLSQLFPGPRPHSPTSSVFPVPMSLTTVRLPSSVCTATSTTYLRPTLSRSSSGLGCTSFKSTNTSGKGQAEIAEEEPSSRSRCDQYERDGNGDCLERESARNG